MQNEKSEPPNVLSFADAKRKRDFEEEQRLERMVIERWTGKEEEGNG